MAVLNYQAEKKSSSCDVLISITPQKCGNSLLWLTRREMFYRECTMESEREARAPLDGLRGISNFRLFSRSAFLILLLYL